MKIEVLETTLRDGVQAEGISLSLEDKVALIKLFDGLCFDYIEAGTPSGNPRDKQLLCDKLLPHLQRSKVVAFGATRHKKSLTDEDISLKTLAMSNCEYVSLVGKSSLTHIEKVLNVSKEDNLKMIYDSIRYLCDKGKTVFFDAEHFYDGFKENADYAIDTLRTAKNAGASLLVLCDTNGSNMPEEIFDITKKIVRTFKKDKIGIHCHNDCGMAVANTMAAVSAGASHIQGTFLGFGERCGNCNLSTVIPNLQLKKNYDVIPDNALKNFTSSALHIAEITNIRLFKNLPYIGKSAFSHKGGMHADGVMKYAPAFEHVDPSTIGNERRFLLSDVAGKATFNKKAAEILPDFNFTDDVVNNLLSTLKTMEMQGYQFEGADASFAIFIRKNLGLYESFFELINFEVVSNQPSKNNGSATAVVKIKVGERLTQASASGNGPVNALDAALRNALKQFYPVINKISLLDYKVRVINSEAATKATVRVLITSTDGREVWTTVGVSTDIIEASWKALCDSLEYRLFTEKSEE